MPRDLDTATATAFAAAALNPVLFLEIGTADPAVFLRAWSGVGVFAWDGKEWLGAGDLASISTIEETREISAPGVTYELAGVPAALLPDSIASMRQGAPCRLWIGAVDATLALVGEPALIDGGRVDQIEGEDDGRTATFRLQSEGWLVDFRRSRVRRYTSEDQKLVDATDRGFEYVAYLQDAQILWGRT